MNKVTVTRETVSIEITGWDKFWSLKGSVTIPRATIAKAYRHDAKLKPPFFKFPGTALPGIIIAGTYYGKSRKEFWNTHYRGNAIVFDLKDAEYTRIVIDVENPEMVLEALKCT